VALLKIEKKDQERFAHIQRDTSMGYAITMKDLVWLVRLVEKLDKEELMKKTVNFIFVEVADAKQGKKVGVECDACGERFFDRLSLGSSPRMLASGVGAAIEHAEKVHQSTGGRVGKKRKVN
jgi:hypothetical protein